MRYERNYQYNLQNLEKYDWSELFTIKGMLYYDVDLTSGLSLRELDNEFEWDAIAVYDWDKKQVIFQTMNMRNSKCLHLPVKLKDKTGNDTRGEFCLISSGPQLSDIWIRNLMLEE